MIYSILLAVLFEVVFFFYENWGQLTITLVLTGLAFIIGKRLGVKLTIDYIAKRFNLFKKSAHELQTEHHEIEIVKLGGQPWNGTIKRSSPVAVTNLKRLLNIFTKVTLRKKLSSRRKSTMKKYLLSLTSTRFQAYLIITITNIIMLIGFLLNVEGIQDVANAWTPMINIGAQAITTSIYIWAKSKSNIAITEATTIKAINVGGNNEPDYTKSDSTSQ